MKIKTPQIRFLELKWPFIAASILLIAMTGYLYFTKGLNYGIDFKGGLTMLFQFSSQEAVTERKIDEVLRKAGKTNIVVQRFGKLEENTFVLRTEVENIDSNKLVEEVQNAFKQDLTLGTPTLLKNDYVGPKAGKELKRKGQFSMLIAWVVILLYIGFRFDFYFAPGAIVALIHDVLITVGVFALTGREVNLTVVSALLTIIGYSINDTIVIYDRIRENVEKHKTMTLEKIIDLSLNETLSRTIVTALTVFFVVLVLFLRADGDIQDFALAMVVGTIVGSYSSLFVASPIYLFCKKVFNKKPA